MATNIANGSATELDPHFFIASESGYLEHKTLSEVAGKIEKSVELPQAYASH